MKRPMPLGYDDYRMVRDKNLYLVDKTGFIKELLDRAMQVTLITRPRRFGKSLNMSMLQYFFDVNGAEANRKLFEGTFIESADDGVYMKSQGKFPVVSMTMKDWTYDDLPSFRAGFLYQVSSLFMQFNDVVMNSKANDVKKRRFEAVVNRKADMPDYDGALRFLVELLQEIYGRTVVLLVDEYDAPIQYAWSHGYYDDCVSTMRKFLSGALKTNPSLNFAVLTGVTRVTKESIFSGLNNLTVCSILRSAYSQWFGFTQAEVNQIACDYDATEKLDEIKNWYDGYRIGNSDVYNPFSVANYFANDMKPEAYWMNTSSNSILHDLLTHADEKRSDDIKSLLDGKPVVSVLQEGTIYADLGRNESDLFTMMLSTGYLKPCKKVGKFGGLDKYELAIPNYEVRRVYADEILQYLMNEVPGFEFDNMVAIHDGLIEGKPELFAKKLENILGVMVSDNDTWQENFYHGMVLGLTGLLFEDYEVRSNRESGNGRYDIALFPRGKGAGVIIELKAADESSIDKAADEAIRQIKENDYMAEFCDRNISPVHLYGIAFCGKKFSLKSA